MTYVPMSDAQIERLFRPFAGEKLPRSVDVKPFPEHGISTPSYWSGGQKDLWAVVHIQTGSAAEIPENGSGFTGYDALGGVRVTRLPEGCVLVRLRIGSPGPRAEVYGPLAPVLPSATPNLTHEEEVVLACVRNYIPKYRREYAARYGVGAKRYDEVTMMLKAKGMLAGNGGLTLAGKNADIPKLPWA